MLRTFTGLTPVEIVRSGGPRELYDSLVFANVARMAKYGRLGNSGRLDDGLFEVVSRRHGRRWRIGVMALRAATVGLGTQAHVSRVEPGDSCQDARFEGVVDSSEVARMVDPLLILVLDR